MSEQREAAPVLGHRDGQAEAGTIEQTTSGSCTYCTTIHGGGQLLWIADFLGRGQENAVPLWHLTQMTGLRSRDLRRRIQHERLAGVPILSNNADGYFLPANEYERRRFVASMRGRAAEIEAVAAAVEGADV